MSIQLQVQRAFADWLKEAQPDIEFPISIGPLEDEGTELSFHIAIPYLQGWLSFRNLSVSVNYDDTHWDTLLDLDVLLEKVDDGYICGLCTDENGPKTIFKDEIELWRDHLFEPLRTWINEELLGSLGIALYRTRSGASTWAKLCKSDELKKDPDVWLPINPTP